MFRRILVIVFSLLMFSSTVAHAQSSSRFEVEAVRILGLERISEGTVYGQVGFGIGDLVDDRVLSQAINRLYATGLFSEIEIGRDDNTVIIELIENPTIRTIRFENMTELDKDKVLALFAGRDIAPGRVFKRGDEEFIRQGVETFYQQVSRFLTSAKVITVPLEDNRVDIVVEVTESEEARITQIRFHGLEAFDEADIKSDLELRDSGLFVSFFDRDQYDETIFLADLERLRTFYANSGYIRFEILSHDVSIDPAGGGIHIDIFVSEGARYLFGDVEVNDAGNFLSQEIQDSMPFTQGAVFNDELVEEYRNTINNHLRDQGYAFSQTRAATLIDDESLIVNVRYSIIPGAIVQVNEIRFIGNNITSDEVLRQQMELFEGEIYDQDKLDYSLTRLRRTNYILGATANQIPISANEVDIEIVVAEANRGAFLIGVGYSSADKLVFNLNFQRSNIFGSGNDFSASAETGSSKQSLNVNFHQANITDSGISRTTGIFMSKEKPSSVSATDHSFNRYGLRVNYRIPLDRDWSWTAGLEGSKVGINNYSALVGAQPLPATSPTDRAREYALRYGDSQNNLKASLGLRYDTRDRATATTEGLETDLTFEVALPPTKAKYYKVQAVANYFYPIVKDRTSILQVSGRLGFADEIGNNIYPYYERFFVGAGQLRGFHPSYTGIRDARGASIGGRVLASWSVETETQLDIFDGQSVRGGVFFDAAGLWEDFSDFSDKLDHTRASVGVVVKIRTPVFPLSFSYAFPISREENDVLQKFQFRISL